ncbi:efflux RND transporter periplasmic adaptor subunit [Phenylobacterium sp.]|uniref:efflux RND transporter periplasmic adaptor subunit n=1 Tax=Phenylobacterium sp. TaxID=1871053 RepID=UPI002717ED41|nr:efflux RND transporter periplasmic adaptor subunit [Phenylobacterium sp.]MDO8800897.1 efflux RND transporter periplasmic adaptor subunit [Phenylobacterium sp.]
MLRPLPVTLAAATRGEAVDTVYASGVVEYVRQARIAPVVTAPIRQVLVTEGQAVAAGQPLAQLEDGPQAATALQLEAQAGLARAAARRIARLYAVGFAARAADEDARSQVDAAQQAARSARVRLEDYRLRAPFAGQVLRREAEPGDLAAAGVPLFVVAVPGALRVTAGVDERDVGRLAVGREAVIRADAFPGQVFASRIAEITPQGDATGRVFRARLSLDPATVLRPGMTVEANLVIARRPAAILVPTPSLREGAVWIAAGGRVHRRAVTLGVQGAERTEVLAGVKVGERLVLDPPADLKDGDRIAPRPEPGR